LQKHLQGIIFQLSELHIAIAYQLIQNQPNFDNTPIQSVKEVKLSSISQELHHGAGKAGDQDGGYNDFACSSWLCVETSCVGA
jgi:hypothetical protein